MHAMDHPTPFPGKTQALKPKTTRKNTDASTRTTAKKEPPISKQKRVFGTIRSTNIQVKTVTENPITKQPKSITRRGNPSINATTDQVARKPERFKKERIESQEKVRPNLLEPKTPVASHSMIESKVAAGTPYHSAKYCSKCRFDKLETASYWLGQIKLAESVGKHFVSVAFFRLAFDSNAEPIRNLRVDLKRYMGRHGYLCYETDWKDVSRSYGILKDESNVGGESLEIGKGKTTCSDCDQQCQIKGMIKEQEAV